MKNKYAYLSFVALAGLVLFPAAFLYGQGCESLISYWRMEEKTGPVYRDIVGGHDAIALTSAPARDDGKVGKAQSFNGISNYLTVSGHDDFDWGGKESFTIELWVKLHDISTRHNMVFIGRDADTGPVHWWVGAEKSTGRTVFALIGSGATFSAVYGPEMQIGEWYHVVAVRNADFGVNRLYVNSFLESADTVDYSAENFRTSATIDIGVMNFNGSTDTYFAPAVIDELAIYDVVLPDSVIDTHYNKGLSGVGYCEEGFPVFQSVPDSLAVLDEPFIYEAYATGESPLTYSLETGPGSLDASTGVYTWTPTELGQSGTPVTISASNNQGKATQRFRIYLGEAGDCPDGMKYYYKLEETSGTTYTDLAGGNNAFALNTPVPVAGKSGMAQEFDGVDDGIIIPDDGELDIPGDSSFSIELWVKTPGGPGNMVFVGRQGTILDQDESKLHLWVGIAGNSGDAMFYLRDSMGNEPMPNGLLRGGFVGDNQWHYIVAVRDANTMKNYLYVDGNQVAESAEYDYQSPFASFEGDPFNMGFLSRKNGNPDYFLDGILDEVAIYYRALSAAEVGKNFQQSQEGKWHCAPVNYAPAFISVPDTVLMQGEIYEYQIQADDVDAGDTLVVSAEILPDWLNFTDLGNGAAILSGTPVEVGTDTVVLSVTDGEIAVKQFFTIEIQGDNQNYPPVITSDPNTSAEVGELYTFVLTASDPDGDTLYMSAVIIPGFLQFDTITGTLEGTPSEEDIGDHYVELAVSDGTEVVSLVYTLIVSSGVNNPPVIISIPDTIAVVDELYSYVLVATDPDDDTLTMTAVSIPGFLQFDTITGTLEGTPALDDVGTYVVELAVGDGIDVVALVYSLRVAQGVGMENSADQITRLYPVPADQFVVLELDRVDNGLLTVIDLTGKHVIEREIRAGENRIQLDVSGLEEGLYMFRLQAGERVSIRAFTINR